MPRKKRAKTIATLDFETDPFEHEKVPEPFCCGLYFEHAYFEFWGDDCVEQVIEHLVGEKDIIIYAHNGGKFDYHFMLEYFDPAMMIINGRIAKATLFGGDITFLDSYLILPMALSKYKKDEIDYNLFTKKNRYQHKKAILEYLKTDCIYLHEWVMLFRQRFGNKMTLAGSAFEQLKQTGYDIPNGNAPFDALFRPYYFGGRVQCFKTGSFKGDYEYIDINSAYSFAMLSKHWYGFQLIRGKTLPDLRKNGSWFADISAISRGALPWRGDDNKLYFPDSDQPRRFQVTGWEIKAGLATKTLKIVRVYNVLRPVFTEDFKTYVKKFHNEKKKASEEEDSTTRTFAKLMLNSPYGRLAIDPSRYEKFEICERGELPETYDDYVGTERSWQPYSDTITGKRVWSRKDPSSNYCNVATAASITGYVRAYLWRAICESEEPLYCDTDSIICKRFHGQLGSDLGDWELEFSPREIYIAQRKMYAMRGINKKGKEDTKVASKGVRLSFDEIKEGVTTGKNMTYFSEAPTFSLRFGARFLSREINFEEIEKNALTFPE